MTNNVPTSHAHDMTLEHSIIAQFHPWHQIHLLTTNHVQTHRSRRLHSLTHSLHSNPLKLTNAQTTCGNGFADRKCKHRNAITPPLNPSLAVQSLSLHSQTLSDSQTIRNHHAQFNLTHSLHRPTRNRHHCQTWCSCEAERCGYFRPPLRRRT